MAPNFKFLVLSLFCITISVHLKVASGQGMNLLQKYLRKYFNEYSPNTVRSYTLYGNGQNGVADFQAGLPYPLEKTGKVKNLVFSPMSNPLPNPRDNKRAASQKSGSGNFPHQDPQNTWVNPISSNSFNPWTVDPSQIKVPVPAPLLQYLSSSRSDLQVEGKGAESRTMITSGEFTHGTVTSDNRNTGEIAIQSSLAFRK